MQITCRPWQCQSSLVHPKPLSVQLDTGSESHQSQRAEKTTTLTRTGTGPSSTLQPLVESLHARRESRAYLPSAPISASQSRKCPDGWMDRWVTLDHTARLLPERLPGQGAPLSRYLQPHAGSLVSSGGAHRLQPIFHVALAGHFLD